MIVYLMFATIATAICIYAVNNHHYIIGAIAFVFAYIILNNVKIEKK